MTHIIAIVAATLISIPAHAGSLEVRSAQMEAIESQTKLCKYLVEQAGQAEQASSGHFEYWDEKSNVCMQNLNQMWIVYNTSH